MASNSSIYNFKWSNLNRQNNYNNIITYSPIFKGLIFLLIIIIIIYISNKLISNILTYSLALAAPFITVTLIHLKESFSALTYEKKLTSALYDEIIFNLHSIKANENIINNEAIHLKNGTISTDPLVKMVWDVWEIVRFHYASKEPNFDLNTIYNYIRGLYVLNEAIDERKLYTTIHISSRKEFNKVIYNLGSQTIFEIKDSLETINAKMYIFNDNITIDEVADT